MVFRVSLNSVVGLVLLSSIICTVAMDTQTDTLASSALPSARRHIAACRSKCLNEVGREFQVDSKCESDPNCNMCWKTCELFYTNFTLWGPMCDEPSICFPGCQTSCGFYRSEIASGKANFAGIWTMAPIKLVKDKEEELNIEWTRPKSVDELEYSRLVYVVMLRNNLKWTEVGQTIQEQMIVEDYRYSKEPTYITLLAFSKNGLVSERVDIYDNPNDLFLSDQPQEIPRKTKMAQSLNPAQDISKAHWVPHLTSLITKKSCFGVETKVTWPHAKSGNCKYEVTWRAQDSRFDVVGTLYTNENFADFVLWPDYIHSVRVGCLDDNGSISETSESLTIDPRFASLDASVQFERSDCTKYLLLETLIATTSSLAVLFFIAFIICIIKINKMKENRSMCNIENGKESFENRS